MEYKGRVEREGIREKRRMNVYRLQILQRIKALLQLRSKLSG